MKKKLLINFVFYRPVGHLVEAIVHAKGYAVANKNLEIYLLANSRQPLELARSCPWIKKVYPIDLKEVEKRGARASCLRGIPRQWDYIAYDGRTDHFKEGWDENDLIITQAVLRELFMAKLGKEALPRRDEEAHTLAYCPNAKASLPIPEKAKAFAKRYQHRGKSICIMLGGSAGDVQSPTTAMWLAICQALSKSIPGLKIYFTGIMKGAGGRTATAGFSMKDVRFLVDCLPDAESAYDIGIWNQLALIQKCDVFLSPHTGFAFLAPLVGTPWLALSNCRWPEYLFNRTPFYSVLPDCGYYPALEETKKGCGKLLAQDKKALCMTDALLEKKIPEIAKGAALLMSRGFTFEKAMRLHLKKIRNGYDPKKFEFFDRGQGLPS